MIILINEMIYQQVGTTSSKASLPDISQESRIHFGFDIFGKNGRNQESEQDHCGVPTQLTQ